MLDDQSSRVSVSEVSASTETNNPFMSTKAQSFMPTSFIPSPNKTVSPMVIQANQFSPDFSPSPLKPQGFGLGAQPSGLGIPRMPFKSLSVIEVPKEELAGSARSNGSTEDKADGGYITSSNPFKPSNNVPLGKQKSM